MLTPVSNVTAYINFITSYFVTNFTFNGSAGMNSALQVQPYTSQGLF